MSEYCSAAGIDAYARFSKWCVDSVLRHLHEQQKATMLDWHESDLFYAPTEQAECKPKRRMALGWFGVAAMAACLLTGECVFAFCLFFAAGWANGWPFGLSFQLVISVGWTACVSVTVLTAAVGLVCLPNALRPWSASARCVNAKRTGGGCGLRQPSSWS